MHAHACVGAIKNKTRHQARFTCFIFTFANNFIGSRCKFCNFPSISCSTSQSKNTSSPNNHAPSPLCNRDRVPYPCSSLPIHQSVYRILDTYIAKKALSVLLSDLLPYYTPKSTLLQAFPLYKIALPLKKLSKKPLTSSPTFSKQAIKCSGCAIAN